MRNGNLLKSRVNEICVKRIHVNQGVGVCPFLVNFFPSLNNMKNTNNENFTFSKRIYPEMFSQNNISKSDVEKVEINIYLV